MIILEKPYTSDIMLNWLAESQHPVLANDYARHLAEQGRALRLTSDNEAARRIAAGERLYTCSENALDWVIAHTEGHDLARTIQLCKDKFAMREALSEMDERLFFRKCTMEELLETDPSTLPMPVVVKPTVGFVSFGVHVVKKPSEWAKAVACLREEVAQGTVFPDSVISNKAFIIEGFITGQEYAVDLYYNNEGSPIILNVMQHDFRDSSDTSDHLYFTSPSIIKQAAPKLGRWFAQANNVLGFKNACMHIELRVNHDDGQDPLDAMSDIGRIHIIEFNPLRFSGYCSTEIAYYAFGLRTYEWYLEDEVPAWNKICANNTDADDGGIVNETNALTAFIALEPPTSGDGFDHDAFERDVRASSNDLEACELRRLDPQQHGLSAFPIVHIPADGDFEGFRQFALNVDPNRYCL